MDRDEAIGLLRGGQVGIAEWNRLRTAGETTPDLSGVDLRGANLQDANLDEAQLQEADLSGVDLYGASLSGVILRSAKLDRANLQEAEFSEANLNNASLSETHLVWTNLKNADLSGANLYAARFGETTLIGAKLCGANLSFAVFNEADLSKADLSDAECQFTTFSYVDLSVVRGLESIVHIGPSTLGTDTLIRSLGKIPESFLRGCGLPDAWIANLPALIGALEPIQFYSVFISYSSEDTTFAERLHTDLQSKGVRCWFAPEDLKWGERIRVGIDEAIRVHDKLLLVLSKNSVASDWVEKEVETAMEQERRQKRTVLFPIRLDDGVMKSEVGWAADIRRSRNIGDFRKWKDHVTYQKSFDRLLRDLKAAE